MNGKARRAVRKNGYLYYADYYYFGFKSSLFKHAGNGAEAF